MYNITMTSLPIMWFAIYDFEYEKDRVPADSKDSKNDFKLLGRNPLLYKIGMNNQCFSLTKLALWILYAIYHSAIIYFSVLYVIMQQDAFQADGKDLGFWLAGHSVYGACIFIVNTLLILRCNTHTIPGIIFFSLMFAAFFVFVTVEA